MRMNALAAAAAIILLASSISADARGRGKCDGIHRCTCGSTQARLFGLPRVVRGHNLWRAVEWKSAFPRTSARAGVVMYQRGGGPSGHVSRIDQVTGKCTALVTDERGQYERDICGRGATFVDPNGNAAFTQINAQFSMH